MEREYVVVRNAEDQHSLWPAGKAIPAGWELRYRGNRESCLEYVRRAWTDILPLSLRSRADRAAPAGSTAAAGGVAAATSCGPDTDHR